jgi:hypothetical protein
MGKMALGYGSEWHVLRYLGRYRETLNAQVRAVTGVADVRWLDWNSTPAEVDAEWKGVTFLPDDLRARVRAAWSDWWPQRGNPPNWDAVASLDGREWLLVEAKAHPGELKSTCAATPGEGREQIARAFAATQAALGVREANWMNDYYQAANRVAFLHFLQRQGIPARMLFIYFVGDLVRPDRSSPQSADAWSVALQAQDAHLGLPPTHALSGQIHKLFLPVYAEDGCAELRRRNEAP